MYWSHNMKNKLAKPDIALMSFAISVSKKAAVVTTIKYGRVMVSNGDIDVELQFESQIDDFQIILVPENNPFWKFSIPLTKLLKVDEIEAVLFTLLGVRRIPSEIKPIISIPYNYFQFPHCHPILFLSLSSSFFVKPRISCPRRCISVTYFSRSPASFFEN